MTKSPAAIWPGELKPLQEGLFAALAAAAGGRGRRLLFVPVRLRGFPETAARADEALRRAKRQPRTAFGRTLKRALLAGQYNWARAFFIRHPDCLALAWNGLTGTRFAFMQGAKDAGAARLYCELAPLGGYVTVDPQGVNAEGLAATADVPADAPAADFSEMRQGLVARASRRADVGQRGSLPADAPPFVFVPLQVPDDSQIRLFAGWVRDLPGFLAAIGKAAPSLPEGWQIRIKEHPSAKVSLAAELAELTAGTDRVVVDNQTDTFELVAKSRAVLTINSSVGFQAFVFDMPVLAVGRSFWTRPELALLIPDQDALNVALAAPEAPVDSARRAAFAGWLKRDYVVAMTDETSFDKDALAAKVALARERR